MKKCSWLIIVATLTGCSSSPPLVGGNEFYRIFPSPGGNGPVPPAPEEPGLPIPGPGGVNRQTISSNAPLPVPKDNPSVSIMSMSGPY
ncbi:Uncharacterised protein [Salmonella enterica subsp. arizonae]|nr:Uncharacterised protein [Salmonella enterica subsp. arizonae]